MQETEVSTYCGASARCFSADKMALVAMVCMLWAGVNSKFRGLSVIAMKLYNATEFIYFF